MRIGDQADADFLAGVVAEFGAPAIVIDDESHRMADVTATFRSLYRAMAPDGVYVIEDMGAAYRPRFGGGVGGAEGSMIEVAKGLVDELNADWSRRRLRPTEFTRSSTSVCFYDAMIVFERGDHRPARMVRRGRRPAP